MKNQNYINGQWSDAHSGNTLGVENPFTEDIITDVPASDETDVNYAVEAAKNAFEVWRKFTAAERCELMGNMAKKSRDHAEELAKTITSEMGKPFGEALEEIETVADYLEYYGQLARDHVGRIVAPATSRSMSLVRYEPFGVVGCIIPWNYPLSLMGWKLAPVLAAGNTIVMKPSEISSLSILHWIDVAGGDMPAGVMNVITGYGKKAGEALVKHPDVPVITFTGSVVTGKRIARLAADNLKKVSLELGGKDPVIICDDADIEGKFEGNLNVSGTLTLKATAHIEGEVIVGKLSVEPGATFNATCTMHGTPKANISIPETQISESLKTKNHPFDRTQRSQKAKVEQQN